MKPLFSIYLSRLALGLFYFAICSFVPTGWAEDALPLRVPLPIPIPSTTTTLKAKLWNDDATGVTNAAVIIIRAHPKTGESARCATCYPDCQKMAQTDELGQFVIENIDPSLVFDLLVSAPGYQTKLLTGVDPKRFHNDFTIPYIDAEALKSSSRLAGVALDSQGLPASGCIMSCDRFARGGSTQWGGVEQYMEPLIVADRSGRFWSRCEPSVTLVHARVDSRGFAREWVDLVPGSDMIVRLHAGVAVTGRVMQNGHGVPGVSLGLLVQELNAGGDAEGYATVTDADGSFALEHVPANHAITLFSKTTGRTAGGSIQNKDFRTAENETKIDLGSIELEKGFTIKGQLLLPPGSSFPGKTSLNLNRTGTGDSRQISTDEEGRFKITNLPPGSVWISMRIEGFKFSKKNPSLDWYNGAIVGRVSADIPNLILALENGNWDFQNEQQNAPAGINLQPNDEPLRAAPLDSKGTP